jgi:hypothetical protein
VRAQLTNAAGSQTHGRTPSQARATLQVALEPAPRQFVNYPANLL